MKVKKNPNKEATSEIRGTRSMPVTMKNKCKGKAKKTPKPKPSSFDPKKETKKEREARLNTIVKKALENITRRA